MEVCDRCGQVRRIQRYCHGCKAARMRAFRKTHALTPFQRLKMNCRCYANEYQRRGKLIPEPCADCGDAKVQKHHPDYSKPLEVVWLCRPCHLARHRSEAQCPSSTR